MALNHRARIAIKLSRNIFCKRIQSRTIDDGSGMDVNLDTGGGLCWSYVGIILSRYSTDGVVVTD